MANGMNLTVLLGALAFGCAGSGLQPIDAPGVELTVHFAPDVRDAGLRAMARINAATAGHLVEAIDGVDVDGVEQAYGNDGDAVCGATEITWYAETHELVQVGPIEVTTGGALRCNSLEATIIHELMHAMMGTSGVHADSGVFHAFSGHGELLNEDSLGTLCENVYCPAFIPE